MRRTINVRRTADYALRKIVPRRQSRHVADGHRRGAQKRLAIVGADHPAEPYRPRFQGAQESGTAQGRRGRLLRRHELALIGAHRGHAAFPHGRHVHDERRRKGRVQQVVVQQWWAIRLAVADLADAGEEAGFAHQAAGPVVVGMAVFPVGSQHDTRARLAYHVDDRHAMIRVGADAAVRQAQAIARRQAEQLPWRARVSRTRCSEGAAAGQLPRRQVRHRHPPALVRRGNQAAPAAELDVVRVGGERQDVQRLFHTCQPPVPSMR